MRAAKELNKELLALSKPFNDYRLNNLKDKKAISILFISGGDF